jgi:hypothetical protein
VTSDRALRVDIHPPAAGWITIVLSRTRQRYEFDTSYTPTDGIDELISALLAIASADNHRAVRWHQEPSWLILELTRRGPQVDIRLRGHEPTDERFALTGSVDGVLHPFAEALTRLQASQPPEDYQRAWRHPFPSSALERLRAALRG